MKIILTGGAGFIGSHLVDAYLNQGHHVLVLDNLSTGIQSNLDPRAEFANVDITTPQATRLIHDFQPDVINHHAAQINVRSSINNPQADAKTNILGFLNLLEAARTCHTVKKIVFASTGGAIYGDTDNLPTPETHPANPLSPYGIGKLTGEHYLYFYQKVHALPSVVLRYANVYGPRQNPHGEAGIVAIFFQKVLSGQPFTQNGDGRQTRDFVYVQDVVQANLLATDSSRTGIYNIGTGRQTSVSRLIELMSRHVAGPQIQQGPAIKGEMAGSCLDPSKAKQDLNWTAQTNLDIGLAQTAKFFSSKK